MYKRKIILKIRVEITRPHNQERRLGKSDAHSFISTGPEENKI